LENCKIIVKDGEKKISKKFLYNGFIIKTKLLFKPAHGGVAGVPEPQRKYWFDNFETFSRRLLRVLK